MTLKDRNRVAGKFLLQSKLMEFTPRCFHCQFHQHHSRLKCKEGIFYWIGKKNGKIVWVLDPSGRKKVLKKGKGGKFLDIIYPDKNYNKESRKSGITVSVFWCPDFKRKKR